jgi:DNA helicase HerA-like ATPase
VASELSWHELVLPRDLDLATVTTLLRPLASRPRLGLIPATPVVALETHVAPGLVRWLLGLDVRLVSTLPVALRAQLPGVVLVPMAAETRPRPLVAANVRLSSFAVPLRLDTAEAVSAGVLGAANLLQQGESVVLQWVIGPSHQRAERPEMFNLAVSLGLRQPTRPAGAEGQAWRSKSGEPLHGVRGRVGASAASPRRAASLVRSVGAALQVANSGRCMVRLGTPSERRARDLMAAVHQPLSSWSSVVNTNELAMLASLPLGQVEVPGRSTTLAPAPASLLAPVDAAPARRGQRTLGLGLHPLDGGQLVTVPEVSSNHHVHVIGPTGSGKSNLLAQMSVADIEAGHAVLLLEPRGDLVADVLARIPDSRRDDVVVIDPAPGAQGEPVVGFNPLSGPLDDAERRANELVGLFNALYGSSIGPRSADVLLHAGLAVARLDDGNLADIPQLLTNPVFRRRVLSKVTDPLVLGPWFAQFDARSEADQQQIVAPITNKLRSFLSRAPIRHMLAQARPAFTMDDLFTKRRIVAINLNRGVIGPEAARLLGSLLLSSFWAAAERRATTPRAERYPVMATIDEFQSYIAALDFDAVLSQGRGLGLSLTIAHQNTDQLTKSLQATVAANARSRVTFRPSPSDERQLAALLGRPAQPDDLAGLGAFQTACRLYVDGETPLAFAVRTLPLPPASADSDALRAASRRRFGVDGDQLDAQLLDRWHGVGGPPDGPVGTRRRRSQ